MKTTTTLLLMLTISIVSISKSNNNSIRKNKNGIIEYAEFKVHPQNEQINIPRNADSFFKKFLSTSAKDEFVKIPNKFSNDIFTHVHYDQYYDDVKVDRGGYNFHYKDGRMYLAHGNYIKIEGLNTNPSLTAKSASQIFASIKRIPIDLIIDFQAELLIMEIQSDELTESIAKPVLVYKIVLFSGHKNNNEIGYIDAQSGELLHRFSLANNVSATGTFATLYNDSKQATTDYNNNKYNLYDATRGSGIHTWNAKGTGSTSNPDELEDDDNNWTAADLPQDNIRMGLDIHWGLQKIYDYFKNKDDYYINSFDNNGSVIEAYVNYIYDNDPEQAGYFHMVDEFFFGPGGTNFDPLASIDVVAHEYGHAITYHNIGWDGNSQIIEENAIDEGMSDIWAVILENRIAPGSIWKMGEQIDKVYGCKRNLQDTYDARDSIANTYFSAFYNRNQEEYARSGVFSHWFYLLVNGGTGINEKGDNYDVNGIGMDAAEDLIFEAVFHGYLNDVSNYTQLRSNTVAAAKSSTLFGVDSYQTIQIQNAWYAVGVGTEPTDVTLSTSGVFCSLGSTVTATNCPPGATISWTTSPNLTVQSGGTTTTPTIRAINTSVSGLGTVQIHFTSNDYTAAGPVLEVWVGKPDIPITSPSGYPTIQLNSGAMLNVSLSNTPGAAATSGSWWSTGSIDNIGSSGASCMFEATGTGIGNFYVTTTNDCGTSVAGGGTVNVSGGGGGGMLMVFPNPATESFEIQLDESVATSNEKEIESELRIYDQYNSLKEIRTFRGKKYKIYTNRLTKGLYLIEVVNKNGKFTTKVIVNKN